MTGVQTCALPIYGRVLVGIQVPPENDERFHKFLEKLGYPYVDESQNPVYKLFL